MAIDESAAARKQILDRIRRAQGRAAAASPADHEAVETYLRMHPRGPLPDLEGDLVALFRTRAEASQSTSEVVAYETDLPAFDPVGATNHGQLWHRGYPLQLIPKRDYSHKSRKTVTPDVQADFWDGDPDIDAVCRMIYAPECKFDDKYFPMAGNKLSPFNSQNTFISGKWLKDYFLFPHVGRMDDIWAAYYVEALGAQVVYNKATVYQQRNIHDLVVDMKKEYCGYENNLQIVNELPGHPEAMLKHLPAQSAEAFKLYQRHFHG